MTTLDISLRKRVTNLLFPRYSPLLDRMNWSARWTETVRQSNGCPKFPNREEMYRHLNAEFFGGGNQPIDYFEFGVFEGKSITFWSALNPHPESRFFGFDSFEGLPENWNPASPAGAYNACGKIPQTSDKRIQFIVGWFQNSLPGFLAAHNPRNPVIIHSDSDLYSSTLYSLTAMNPLIAQGTFVIFDEFYDPLHEYRALHDYASSYLRKYQLIAATPEFTQATIKIL
ncbi:MAG: TylF/MycF/NovP-related O-methyltransferase [Candidatus Acidiferrales bacterium]